MRIVTLGGGPGGLYASLLLKRSDPSHEITLYEQNPPDATYGWGVVFSDRTLGEFREADYRSYVDITERFVVWDAIDIHYRGSLVRAGGQPFAGIARKQLLGLLQERCRELGVEMRFQEQIEDLSLLRGADLVIAADGVNSVARASQPEVFRTTLAEGRARYIWFGTTLPLDSFTFIFRENEHGLFQVHAYPFDGTTSTFIVECHEDVWRLAGLDDATIQESISYCEELFADDLRGRPLLSNNSRWISFVTVKNRTWRHGTTVLVGDAAHTAHFSIGSGTKLAMEDSIALVNAFEKHEGDLDAALGDYEMERLPRVERFQEAAQQSQEYFENVRRYTHMEPLQFAFYLLTRSGRIDYTNLRLRDPHLVEEVDHWFAGARGRVAPPPLFQPVTLRGLTVPNRVVASTRPTYGAADGLPDRGYLDGLVEAAAGAGVVVTDPVAVSAEARATPGDPGIFQAAHAEAWAEAVARVHRESSARAGLVLGHAGPRASTRPRSVGADRPLRGGGWRLLAASPIPYGPGSAVPRALAREDMDGLVEEFVEAADLAQRAGFDMLILHMGHGYLLASFISPLTNQRTDQYGGSLEARMRFPLEVFDAVRAGWPKERPLGAVITADDWARSGAGPDEAVGVARMLRDGGCDLIQPVAGQTIWTTSPVYGPAYLAPYADRIRNEVQIPTLVGGGIDTTDRVNTLVAGGRADLCVLD